MKHMVVLICLVAVILVGCNPPPPVSAQADPFEITVDSVGPATWQYSIYVKAHLQRDTLPKITMVELISNSENACGASITSLPYAGSWTRDMGTKTLRWTNTVSGTHNVTLRVVCDKSNGPVYFRIRGSADSTDVNIEERIVGPVAGPVN
jgi:hypothetical protein